MSMVYLSAKPTRLAHVASSKTFKVKDIVLYYVLDMKFLVIGHSFINRLSQFLTETIGKNIRVQDQDVQFIGVRGADIRIIREAVIHEDFTTVQAVHLEVGSNDLATLRPVDRIVQDIVCLLHWLLRQGVRDVYLGEILFRTSDTRGTTMPLTVYNCKVSAANALLQKECSKQTSLTFTRHNEIRDQVGSDGVHLTTDGQMMLWSTIVKEFKRSCQNSLSASVAKAIHKR